jgi:alkylation response protein AidB-like acyl-CoA dehydrogenase
VLPGPGPQRVRYWDAGDAVDVLLMRTLSGEWQLLLDPAAQPVDVTPGIDPAYRLVIATVAAGQALPCSDADAARADMLAAAMLAGIAERTLAMSVDYARVRVQYGKPIGTFQAVKHRCADMAVRAEAAWAITALAAVGVDAELSSARFDATAALCVASGAALENARDNIQNHGAIGFTDEHSAQRYLKRAHLLTSLWGTPAQRRTALLESASPW